MVRNSIKKYHKQAGKRRKLTMSANSSFAGEKLRPISLLFVFCKTISIVISTRLTGAMLEDPILPPNQDAYLPGRSTCLSVALINYVLSKAQVYQSSDRTRAKRSTVCLSFYC